MDEAGTPRVLFVYYTFTKQALRVTEDMESVFRDRGSGIERAEIEFTDPRYRARFERFPFKHRYLDLFRMLPPQLRRATGGSASQRKQSVATTTSSSSGHRPGGSPPACRSAPT